MPKTQEQKRQEAEERRAAYEARTAEEQMELVMTRPGQSLREKARLQGQMNEHAAKKLRKKDK